MRRVPLFVRSARSPAVPPAARPWAPAARRPRLVAGALVVAAVATVATPIAMSPHGILLESVILHEGVAGDAAGVTAQFHAETLALRERALASDDLAQAADAAWPALERSAAPSPMAAAMRVLRRTLVREGRRITADVFALPDHLQIVVREHPSNATLHSRVPRGPDALNRLLADGHAEKGLALLRVAQIRDPALADNAIAIGEALLALHRPAEALAWLSAHPASGSVRARWQGALGIAQVRSGAGPAAQASAAALRVTDPSSVEATRIEAELAAAMKAWPQALGRFGALRLVAPNDGAAQAGAGQALLGMNRPADAIAAYRSCAEISPWQAECQLGLGIALREADQAEDALIPLADAARLDGLDPRIPFETARTLRALLRRDEAAGHSARANELRQRLEQRLTLP